MIPQSWDNDSKYFRAICAIRAFRAISSRRFSWTQNRKSIRQNSTSGSASSRNRLTAVLPSDNGVKRTTTLSIPTITGSTSWKKSMRQLLSPTLSPSSHPIRLCPHRFLPMKSAGWLKPFRIIRAICAIRVMWTQSASRSAIPKSRLVPLHLTRWYAGSFRRYAMLRDANPSDFAGIYIVCGRTDMRLGMDSLAAIIENRYHLPLLSLTHFSFSVADVPIRSRDSCGKVTVIFSLQSVWKMGTSPGHAILPKPDALMPGSLIGWWKDSALTLWSGSIIPHVLHKSLCKTENFSALHLLFSMCPYDSKVTLSCHSGPVISDSYEYIYMLQKTTMTAL